MKYVFLLNMGGADNLKECDVFLKNMFNDKNILPIKCKILRKFIGFCIRKTRLSKMQENYKKIGGKSPLNDISKSLCEKLNQKSNNKVIYDFISTYVRPFASDVLKKYDVKIDDEIILLPLYPHHSKTTVKSSIEDFCDAYNKHFKTNLFYEFEKKELSKNVKIIDIFYQNDRYNDKIISIIKEKNQNYNANVLIISAHSLPVSIVKSGDLYEQHITKHFNILKNKLKNEFAEIKLAYQSKLGPVKWLEPSLKQTLDKLNENSQAKKVLVFPVSFCIDCSETYFELKMEYKDDYNGEYEVCPCPNDSDEFCDILIDLTNSIN